MNGAIAPSRVSAPSGKMQTSSPLASAASTSSKAFCISTGSSFAPAIGIAFAARKIQPKPGVRKIFQYMTKRIGRGTVALISRASI